MDKFWENYITTRPVNSEGAFDAFKKMNQEPRSTIPGPRNMYAGGQLVRNTVDGSRPGYAGKESADRISAIKNYIKDQGKVIDGYEFKEFLSNLGYKKPRDIVKGLEEGGMFKEDMLGKKTITKTERPPRTGINLSKSQITTLNKYASLLNKQEPKKYTSSVFKELGDLERANILQRARANDWKFKATTKWDPLTLKQQQNIIETFDLPADAFKKMEGIQKNVKDISGKYGVTRYLESGKKNPLYDKIQRYVKNGFKFSPKDTLPVAQQREIVSRFELPEGFEKWNFEKYKYGIPSGGSASNPAYTKRIIDYTQGKTRFPNLAADAGTPQGWMMNQYYRTYEHQTEKMPNGTRKVKKGVTLTYKPIFETINGRQKVVGFVDNTMSGKGNTYFGIKKWHNKHGGNLMTTHPDFKNVKKFVDISKRAYAEPNKVITGLLKKGGIEPTGKLQLKHVLNYLAETQGYKATEDAVRIHHQAGVGARGIPGEAVRDLQLLKSEVNSAIMQAETKIRNAVVNNLTPNIDDVNKLKNLGASIKVGGKIYGGGSQTAIGGFKAIEKGAEEAIKKWEPKDFNKFKKYLSGTFQNLSPRSIAQLAKTHGCINRNEGGSAITCLKTKFNTNPEKFLQRSAPLAKNNMNLFNWFKNGRKIARGTGVFAAWEAAFAPLVAGWMATEGESGARMLNEIAYGVPFIGETEKAEWMRYAGGDEKAYAMKRMGDLEEQELPYLYQQLEQAQAKSAGTKEKVPGYTSYHEKEILEDIKEKEQEFRGYYNTPEFWEGPAGGAGEMNYLSKTAMDAYDLEQQTKEKIAADKAARKEDYKIEPIFNFFKNLPRMAGGGMVGIRKPHAIAPTGGPQSQGLASTPEYGTYNKEYKWQI